MLMGQQAEPLRPCSLSHTVSGGLVGSKGRIFTSRLACYADTAQAIIVYWPSIFKSTTDTLFFGAPFQGAGGLEQTETLQATPECQERSSAILWLNGYSEDTLLQRLQAFARYTENDRTLESTSSTTGHGQGMPKKVSNILR